LAENASAKFYAWDKRDGYVVPANRNLYNSYFYPVEDATIDPVKKFYYQGNGFATECDGGVALHNNLNEHLTQKQYRFLMNVAVKAGCNYFTFNIPMTICNDCGYISKNNVDHCEKCGSHNIGKATRVIGFLKEVSNWSEARQKEFTKRSYAKLNE
jgi:ribonucleoside-triphosphate reductase